MISTVAGIVSLGALALAGLVSLAFLLIYWRMYRRSWKTMDSAWIYVVSVNLTVAAVAGLTIALRFAPGVVWLEVARAASLVGFAGAVSYQVYLLMDRS